VAEQSAQEPRRVNWNHAKWAVLDLPAPADLSAWDILCKDFIDAAIGRLDGVCERHDQGHTDGMAARSRSTRPC